MKNRRLTIGALALLAMIGCGEDGGLNPGGDDEIIPDGEETPEAVNAEMIALTGTWLVQTWSVTRESDGLVVNVFSPPSGPS